jgi:hypothetical protein
MTYSEIVAEIENLSVNERLSLITTIAETLKNERLKQHSLLELDGLGADLWQGIEATDYVKSLRSEWDHRP